MKRALSGCAGLGLALCACVTAGGSAGDVYYLCRVDQADAGGRVTLRADLEPDGSLRETSSVWTPASHRQGARLSAEWRGTNPPSSSDDLKVTIAYPRVWLAARRLRVELFRSADSRSGDGVLADPAYYRGGYPLIISLWRSRLQRFAAGEPAILAGVAEQGGELLAQDRIELAQLDLAAPAFARARPRLEAMVADYRNACRLTEEVIILT